MASASTPASRSAALPFSRLHRIAAGDRDARAERSEPLRDRQADAGAAAGDHRDLVLQEMCANMHARLSVLRLRHVEHAVGERRGVREAVRSGPRGRLHRRHSRAGHADGGRQSPPQADVRLRGGHARGGRAPVRGGSLPRSAGARRIHRQAPARRRGDRLPPAPAPRRSRRHLGRGHRARRAAGRGRRCTSRR